MKRWLKEYNASDYHRKLRGLFIGKEAPHTDNMSR